MSNIRLLLYDGEAVAFLGEDALQHIPVGEYTVYFYKGYVRLNECSRENHLSLRRLLEKLPADVSGVYARLESGPATCEIWSGSAPRSEWYVRYALYRGDMRIDYPRKMRDLELVSLLPRVREEKGKGAFLQAELVHLARTYRILV